FILRLLSIFLFSSRRRHTISKRDWSSDVCSSDLTSCNVCNFRLIRGMLLKKSSASATRISSTSAIFFPLNVISSVSLLYLLPSQTSQGTYTSGKKCIPILIIPSPRQPSHRPPFTLKLKRPFLKPQIYASLVSTKTSRISSKTPVYVAWLERGVRPIGAWFTSITFSICFNPFIFSCSPGNCFDLYKRLASDLYKISFTSVLFPEPDTPVTTVNNPIGNLAEMFCKLFSVAPTISICFPFFLCSAGIGINLFPFKLVTVSDFLLCLICFVFIYATICTQCSYAIGSYYIISTKTIHLC